jgi:hypothetical protein
MAATPDFETDLFGWDTVFAISYTKANEAIANNKSSPANFELPWPAKGDDKRTLYGNWGPWRLDMGASGGGLIMRCPVTTGSLWFSNTWVPRTEIDLSSIELKVQCSLTNLDVADARDRGLDAKDITTTKQTGGKTQNLALNVTPISSSQPACSLEWVSWYITGSEKVESKDRYRPDLADGIMVNLAIDKYPKVDATWNDGKGNAPMVLSSFENYFNQYGLQDFEHIFSAFVVGADTTDPKWQWLKPHTVSYAVSMPAANFATLDNCYLGVLGITIPGKVQTASMSQQIDGRMGLAFPDSDSVFAISHELFLKKWLMPGAQLSIPGTKDTDWSVDPTGTTISNAGNLMIGKMYSNEGKTETTDAHVKAGGWNISLDSSSIKVDITGVEFNWDGAGELTKDGYKVVAGYQDWYQLKLASGKDDKGTPYKNVLHAVQAENTKPTPTFVLTETSGERWAKLGLEIGVSIIGSLLGGAAAKALVGPAVIAGEAAATATADGVSGTLTVGLDLGAQLASDSAETIGTLVADSGVDTAATLTTEGVTEGTTKISTSIGTKILNKASTHLSRMWAARWSIVGGMVGGGVGAVVGDIPMIMKNCAEDELGKIATFENFADSCVDGMEWPGNQAGFQLTEVQLRGALLLGGTLTKTQ